MNVYLYTLSPQYSHYRYKVAARAGVAYMTGLRRQGTQNVAYGPFSSEDAARKWATEKGILEYRLDKPYKRGKVQVVDVKE